MKLSELKKEQGEQFIVNNNLSDSHISAEVLCRLKLLPERIDIGFKDNKRLFFEETASSLTRRYYGKISEVARYYLICDGEKVENLDNIVITNNKFTMDFLKEFIKIKGNTINLLKNNGRRPNNYRQKHSIWVTDEELKYVKEFIKKMREQNENN